MEYRNQLFYFLLISWLLFIFTFRITAPFTFSVWLYHMIIDGKKIDFHSVSQPQPFIHITIHSYTHVYSCHFPLHAMSNTSISKLNYKREKQQKKHTHTHITSSIVHIIYFWTITYDQLREYATNQCNHKQRMLEFIQFMLRSSNRWKS